MYSRLFSPLRLGARTVKNRIVSTAHGEQLADSGLITEHLLRYHERRAIGGVGLIIAFGAASVHSTAGNAGFVSLWDERNDPMLASMAAKIKKHGTVLLAQASHRGLRETPIGKFDRIEAVSNAPIFLKQSNRGAPHVLTIPEIESIIESYAKVAVRLHALGWDGIELTGFGMHLMEQFWSPVVNRREDRYGGDFEGRIRFSLEVIQAVADAVPDDFIIALRLSGDLMTDLNGLSVEDIQQIVKRLDSLGRLNLIDVTGAGGATPVSFAAAVPPESYPLSVFNHISHAIRRQIKTPVLVAGKILDGAAAETTLANGDADLVGMTRALIADPDLPRRLQDGSESRIRPCISINQGCRRVTLYQSLACSVNAAVAEPQFADISPSSASKQIMVVGGGPAGMEAARVAKLRGHTVTLYEQSDRLGGQMHDYAEMAGLHLKQHVQWLERELAHLNVEVKLKTHVTSKHLSNSSADLVIVATGAQATIPPEARNLTIPVRTDVDVIRGNLALPPKGAVYVYDIEGRLRGPKISSLLKSLGAGEVHFFFPNDFAGENLEFSTRPPLIKKIFADNIQLHAGHGFLNGNPDGIEFYDGFADKKVRFPLPSLMVFAGNRESNSQLFEMTSGSGRNAVAVGDCSAPRLLLHAVAEGVAAGATA